MTADWPPHPLEYATALRIVEHLCMEYSDGNDDEVVRVVLNLKNEARRDARGAALLDAAAIARRINEAANVPGGHNPRERSWALECVEIELRRLAGDAT